MKENTVRLNPFVYIPETDITSYLLIIISIVWSCRTSLTIISMLIEYRGVTLTIMNKIIIVAGYLLFLLFLIRWFYLRFPVKIIRENGYKELKMKGPLDFIRDLHETLFPGVRLPRLLYRVCRERTEQAITFGTGGDRAIGMDLALVHSKFKNDRDGFKAIFLHEMGHLVNKDVKNAYLVESTLCALLITLPILFVTFIIDIIILFIRVAWGALDQGLDIPTIMMGLPFKLVGQTLGPIMYQILIFLFIIYILSNQMMRSREFYADARALEWERSPEALIRELGAGSEDHSSGTKILSRYHPSNTERIQALKDNMKLFRPNLWIVLAIGYLYAQIEFPFGLIIMMMLLSPYNTLYVPASIQDAINISGSATAIFLFPALMLVISSGFHKWILREYLRPSGNALVRKILMVLKISFAFSVGYILSGAHTLLSDIFLTDYTLMGFIRSMLVTGVFRTRIFIPVMVYLLLVSPMLIRRSFTGRGARRGFYLTTLLSALIYATRLESLKLLIVLSLLTFIIIKLYDKRLSCPECAGKIELSDIPTQHCPNCEHGLYSWAISSFK